MVQIPAYGSRGLYGVQPEDTPGYSRQQRPAGGRKDGFSRASELHGVDRESHQLSLAVRPGVSSLHFLSDFHSCANLDQRALSYAGALAGFIFPDVPVFDELRPEGIEAALNRLDCMD